jgi:serine/threonine-protein kinase
VLDFGVAKAAGRMQTTREGQLKGKLSYMAPEQVRSEAVDRRTDVYATGVVLWEALTMERLFAAENEAAVIAKVVQGARRPPSAFAPDLPKSVDEVVMRALRREVAGRFATAREMALALEAAVPIASATRITDWLAKLVGDDLALRARSVAEIESQSGIGPARLQRDAQGEVTRVAEASGASAEPSSSMSAARTTAGPSSLPRRNRGWLVLGAAGLVVAASAVTFGLTGQNPATPGAAPAILSPAPPPPSEVPVPAVLAPAPPPPSASPSATDTKTQLHTALPKAARPASTPHPKPEASEASSDSSPCTIRSFVDETGIKRFVKECP